jgi:hypothetical protein
MSHPRSRLDWVSAPSVSPGAEALLARPTNQQLLDRLAFNLS